MKWATLKTDLHSEGRLTLHVEVQGVAEASIGTFGVGDPCFGLLLYNRDCLLSGIERDSGIFEFDDECTACIPYCLGHQGQ